MWKYGTFKEQHLKAIFKRGVQSFQLQDSCLAHCNFLQDKTQFCRTVRTICYHCNFLIIAGHLSDRIKYFVSWNEILLVLTDKPALFLKTGSSIKTIFSYLWTSQLSIIHDDTYRIIYDMSLCRRKPTIWVSDQVRHKPVCTATEAG